MLARFMYGFSRHRFGKVPEPVRVAAHHLKVLLGAGAMELALDRSALVENGIRVETRMVPEHVPR